MTEHIKNTIYEIRKKETVTQEELADSVDVTRQTVIAIEKGNYTPSLLLAMKLARYFKKKVDDLFTLYL